jgi:hypothetical protein
LFIYSKYIIHLYTYTLIHFKMSDTANNTTTTKKVLDYIIKYNNETGRLLDEFVFTILSICFRIFITLFQICLVFGVAFLLVFIPLLLITRSYICLYYVYDGTYSKYIY